MKRIKRKTKKEKPVTHDQWIEVRRVNGQTVTLFFPPNDVFEKERQDRDPEPTLIYRRFNFVHGTPSEYEWTEPDFDVRQRGGLFLQRMSVEDWLQVMQAERDQQSPHAICCQNPIERPEAFGPCPCKRCTEKRSEEVAAS